MFILWSFAKIFYFRQKIAKFRQIFAFGENFFEKHKIFPKFYVYFINFGKNFHVAKFREISLKIFAFRKKVKKHFRFNPISNYM